ISTPLREVMKNKRGVCQDFAHLMIGCLRSIGLAGRYVSGYLPTAPPRARPRLIGADASHAWVSVWCGRTDQDTRWIDIDPRNNCSASTRTVRAGQGRHSGSVSP